MLPEFSVTEMCFMLLCYVDVYLNDHVLRLLQAFQKQQMSPLTHITCILKDMKYYLPYM